MSQTTFLSPDRLYERPWRSNHPFNRNLSAGRRWTMIAVFALLCSIIGGYLFVTDARRVKRLAETELARLVGGNVHIGGAKLSLFEGLRLENVNIYIDEKADANSMLFSSSAFLVNYDLPALIAGKLKLTQIVAVDPHVQLIENFDTARWNYQRMKRQKNSASKPVYGGKLPPLPEIILRNAQIDYSEIRNGEQKSRGSMNIEGQFAPTSSGQRYTFELQSRGGAPAGNDSGLVGPTVTGTLDRSGEVKATLKDFTFGKDIRSMLPSVVRDWWDQHGLSGGVDIPQFVYTPDPEGGEPRFEVQTEFKKVKLVVQPAEWMSREEMQVTDWASGAFEVMRDTGLNARGVVDQLARLVEPSPIELNQAQGTFTFTNNGIIIGKADRDNPQHVTPVTGEVEQNTFAIAGRINGYSPLSPATIFISSERSEIPAQPRYINSMPRQVRELYEHLRPQGICALHIKLDRPSIGGKLEVSGSIAIIDGSFVFDKFAYPVRNAAGTIVFGYEPRSDMDQIRLVDLQGHGALGGPNEKSNIKLSGLIGPLNNDVGVSVTVTGENVHDEPLLTAAFPEEVRQALRNLDADGKGDYPKFRGNFECRINRPVGPASIWNIDTDVTLEDAAGKMVAFPYFMEHVTGKLAIREGFVDIIGCTMKKPNDASLTIEGRVTWRSGVGGRPLEPGEIHGHVVPSRPDLKITARNVPIDKDLLDALPKDRRDWITKVGLTGILDIDGHVWRPTPGAAIGPVPRSESGSELTHAFDLNLKHGTIWPMEGTFAISDLFGSLRLLPDRLIINSMSAKRGNADLVARGEVAWPDNQPNVFLSGAASKLELDQTLYRFLPPPAQKAWDAVKPEGIVDVDLSYKGSVAVTNHGATREEPTTQPSTLQNIDLIIHPVKLAATVQAVPYRLDNITGTVRLSNGKVQLTDITGKHANGTVRVSGSGPADRTDWDLHIAAEQIKVDDEFRKALPGGLASLIDSLKLTGTVDFEFPKLEIRDTPADKIPPVRTNVATTSPITSPLDIDFAVKLTLSNTAMDIGVPMVGMNGKIDLQGNVVASKLAGLSGPIDLTTLSIAERVARDFHAEFYKPADQDGLRIGNITGSLSGGEIAGNVDLTFPENGDSRYVMELVLRNADVREVSGMKDENLSGSLSVSMSLQGSWSDPRTRRGRGDVSVTGKEMYKIPLVLGLLQITNLSLPISAPFTDGQAFYSVDGQSVTFERLELRSKDMLMAGSGKLDFAKKTVNMSFTTENPNWPKIPIVGDLAQAAKHELLQIHVKGTLEDPKVSASAVNTVSTTIDEVFRGDAKK